MKPSSLVETHERFELGWNRLQLVIQILVLLVILAGFIGALGAGLFTRRTETISDHASISYDRIVRRTVPTEITFAFDATEADGTVRLHLPYSFLEHSDVASTSPRSTNMQTTADGIDYIFSVTGLDRDRRGRITLMVKPKSFGPVSSDVSFMGQIVSLQQVILP